jgi:hypothetical protein
MAQVFVDARCERFIHIWSCERSLNPFRPSATAGSLAAQLVLAVAMDVGGPAGAADVRAVGRFMIPPIFRLMQLKNRGDHEPRTLALVQRRGCDGRSGLGFMIMWFCQSPATDKTT